MATTRTFQSMLNEYLPLDLLRQEMQKRDYVLTKANKKDDWKGGQLIVPFEGQMGSSIEFGQLAGGSDISRFKYVRGTVSTQPEVWGSMIFDHTDLIQHDGKIPESTFLKILPTQVDQFMTNMKSVVSVNLLNGAHFATFTVDGTALGVIEVDRIDRFNLDQKLSIDDNNSSPLDVYVIAININGGTLGNGSITVSATRGGAAADVSAYTVAQAAKCYHPGSQAASFTALKSQLLSAANGGTASLFGQTKTAYPFLQAVQVDGSAVSASNILQKIFDGYTRRMIYGKGGAAPEVLMSFKHFGSVMKLTETQKGPFNVIPNSMKTSHYGWSEIQVGSVNGQILKLVAIQELDDDVIMYLDWDGITFYTNGMFKRRTSPDGISYFEQRATTGYSYILDHCLFGDLVCHAPAKMAIMHSIPNY
jgi:hypothetical protein